MTKQKLICTTFLKAKISSCNQVDSRLNTYPQYFLEFTDGTKIKAYPTEKFYFWLKHNNLDPNTYYIFNGQFRTVKNAVYEQDQLVCNPLLGIENNVVEPNTFEFIIPIRIFQVFKNVKEKYDNDNFVLASVKNLNNNTDFKKSKLENRKIEFPIKLCINKEELEKKFPDLQLVSKEGYAKVVRHGYSLFMIDFEPTN